MKRIILALSALFCLHISLAQTFTSSNLPVVLINTSGQTIPNSVKITATMGIINNGPGLRNNLGDQPNDYNGIVGIEIRGQSSAGFPMNSYNVELRNATGNEINQSILGLPAESDWVLYAPYTDKTLMHNFLAYTLSNEMGHWAPHCRYVEVKINNDYKGIYVLMEKIKRSAGRLNLANLKQTDNAGDDLTGGYIFSIDKEPNGWYSTHPVPNSIDNGTRQWSYVYPKPDSITPAQKAYIKQTVDRFEDVVASNYAQDPLIGLNKFIDYGSFVDYFIIDEVSRNVDGYRLSTYFHKNKDSKNPKIFAGPVWDYDIAFHNADYCNGSLSTGWALDFNYDCVSYAGGAIPFFWYKIVQEDTIFKNILYCHWQQYRQGILSQTHLNHLIDSISDLTAEARTRHFSRWPILGIYIWPNPQPIPANYAGEIIVLKQWLKDRLLWLDQHMPMTGHCWPEGNNGTIIAGLYPNPLQSFSQLKISSKNSQIIELKATDALGRILLQRKISLATGENFIRDIQYSQWSKGVYFFRITNQNGERVVLKGLKNKE